jgi:hypothetical protein
MKVLPGQYNGDVDLLAMPEEVTAADAENFAVVEWITELRQTTKKRRPPRFLWTTEAFPPHV